MQLSLTMEQNKVYKNIDNSLTVEDDMQKTKGSITKLFETTATIWHE